MALPALRAFSSSIMTQRRSIVLDEAGVPMRRLFMPEIEPACSAPAGSPGAPISRRKNPAMRSALTMAAFAILSAAAHAESVPGPCEQPGAIGAIVDRPGLGRPTANNGSPCVVPSSRLLIEAGYRDQTTPGVAGASTLEVFPRGTILIVACNPDIIQRGYHDLPAD